jgi:hypothetical protein
VATIRIHCPHCHTAALLRPEQILLAAHPGGGTYLFVCPSCTQVTDGPVGPEHVLLLAAAGLRPVDTGRVHRERS